MIPRPVARSSERFSALGADTYRITTTLGYDDYMIAAIELYLDLINLFLFILQLLGSSRR